MTGTDANRLALLMGAPAWFRIDVYGGESPALLGWIAADRIVNVAPKRGRSSATESVGPGSCAVTIKGGYWYTDAGDGVTGVPLTVGLTIEAYITSYGPFDAVAYPARATEIATRFVGTITDLGDVEIDTGDPDKAVGAFTCTTARARFGNLAYTADEFPSWAGFENDELTLDRALESLWNMDPVPFRRVPVFVEAETAVFPNSVLFIPAFNYFVGKTVNDVIDVYEKATGGVFFEKRNGHFRWMTPEERRNAAAPTVLDPSWIVAGLVAGQHVGDVVNYQRVTMYAGGVEGASVEVKDDVSIARRGLLPGDDIDTMLNIAVVDFTDPAIVQGFDIAGGIVGRLSEPAWTTPAVTIDITELLEAGNVAGAYSVLKLDLATIVQLDSLPRRFPGDPGLYWVEGMDEAITSGRWTLTLSLVPYSALTPGTRWIDLPATGLRWIDLPADLTWIRSAAYDPEPFPAGSFRATASDERYRDVGATWATF